MDQTFSGSNLPAMISFDAPGITIHETIGGSPHHRAVMLRLYAEIFPEYAYYLPYMAYKMETQVIDSDPLFIERWWLIEVEGETAGFTYTKYAPGRNCGFSLSTGILPPYRRYRAGGFDKLADFIMDANLRQIEADAAACGKPTPLGMLAEFQLPEPDMTEDQQKWHQHIIDRYAHIGFVNIGVDYREPPHIIGFEPYFPQVELNETHFHRMILSMLPLSGGNFDLRNPQILVDCALMVLVDHYKLPADHWAVQTALQSIEAVTGT